MSIDALPDTQAEAAERTRLADKLFATVRAELARMSVTVHAADGGFLACRWGYCRSLPDLAALEAFAVQLGARPAT
jgi:hypothetical protein